MKKLLLSAAILAATTSFALADLDERLVGNTLILTAPTGGPMGFKGSVGNFFFTDPSNFLMEIAADVVLPGTWRAEGDSLCILVDDQPESCLPHFDKAPVPGASGRIRDGSGAPIDWEVVRGRSF